MTLDEVQELNRELVRVGQRAELLSNGFVRVFDLGSKLASVFDGETGAYRFGDIRVRDLFDMQAREI